MIKAKILSVFIVAFVCAAVLRTFVVEGFIVRGDSMEPTIQSGDYIFINKLGFAWKEPKRGDIIVAKPRGEDFKVIKRIIGLPGERFAIEGGEVIIRVERLDEGVVLEETYLEDSFTSSQGISLIKLDPQEYFALGDNREVSTDSRELGPIDKWQIKGKVFGVFKLSSFKYKGL